MGFCRKIHVGGHIFPRGGSVACLLSFEKCREQKLLQSIRWPLGLAFRRSQQLQLSLLAAS